MIRDASEIGHVAEIVHRPLKPMDGVQPGQSITARLEDISRPLEIEEPTTAPRTRRVAGHAYMVDVEPGRWRIRLKLPDGRDITLDASEELAGVMKAAVDQVVEIESVEELVGEEVASRMAVNLQILPSSGPGSTRPPKSIEELAREQGMPGERPNYVALASTVWTNEEEVEEFATYLKHIRRPGAV